jgi:hypothetical protein
VAVLKLVEYSCRDTISILKVLLSMALKGKLRGIVVCYRTDDGQEDTIFTGIYKAHPSVAVGTSLRMSVAQLQANGEID